jgi:hypothetical protein
MRYLESTIETGLRGGNKHLSWFIVAGGRHMTTGSIAGHAQIHDLPDNADSRLVFPVLAGDGKPLGPKGFKCLYYLENDWRDEEFFTPTGPR